MDVVTWSPQGRLHQVEYAMEAVKQGSCAVGVTSRTHVVMATLKRAPSKLSAHQKKIYHIDNHVGIAISGLTADARLLGKYLRTECLNHRCAATPARRASRLELAGTATARITPPRPKVARATITTQPLPRNHYHVTL